MSARGAFKGLLLSLLALALTAGAAFTFLLDSIAEKAVETAGPAILGVPVKVSAVLISPLSGKGRVLGLFVGNPEGFKTDSLLRVGSAAVEVELKSLLTDTIVVRSVRVEEPQVTFEQAPGGSNVARLQKSLEGGAPASSSGPSKKVIIRDFRLSGGRVRVSSSLIGGKTLDVALPDLHLTGIGAKSGGATAREAVAAVLGPLSSSVVKAVASAGRESVKAVTGEAAKALKNIGGLFKKR